MGKETEGSSSTVERECGFRNGPEVMGKHDTCPPGPLTDEQDGRRWWGCCSELVVEFAGAEVSV